MNPIKKNLLFRVTCNDYYKLALSTTDKLGYLLQVPKDYETLVRGQGAGQAGQAETGGNVPVLVLSVASCMPQKHDFLCAKQL